MVCISSVSYKYVMNDQNRKILKVKRGLRQRDLISHLLFVLIMEYLDRSLATLHDNPNFKYHPKCAKLRITNICFDDDLLTFARRDEGSVQIMMQVFKKFSNARGLKANPAKRKVCKLPPSLIIQRVSFVRPP